MEIVNAMIKLFAAIVLGYILNKAKILNEDINEVMSKIIIYAAGPCMIFSSVQDLDSEKKGEVITIIIAGVGVYVIISIMAFLATKLLHPGKGLEGVYRAALTFGNAAFLAFPVGQALMGDLGVSYLAILNVHNNTFAYSYGVYLLTKDNEGKFRFTPKKLINPGVIAAIIALILFFLNIKMPEVVMEPVDFVGQITSPMAMLIIGSMIATYPLVKLFNNWRYYIAALCKLVIFPMIVFFIARAIWGFGDITKVITLHVAMPSAIILTMLALTNKADSKTVSQMTGLMNILCMATIPLVWVLINYIG